MTVHLFEAAAGALPEAAGEPAAAAVHEAAGQPEAALVPHSIAGEDGGIVAVHAADMKTRLRLKYGVDHVKRHIKPGSIICFKASPESN